jgi:glycosyltransferase involved in cell wall biosynthesis
MTDNHSISVIIPVYNGERYLAESIQSVLAQTPLPDEIIVVDDGSTDATAQIVADLAETASIPIRYSYQTNQGPAAARNTGIRFARGDVLAFQDADDVWLPEKLAVQTALLHQHSDAQAVIGYSQLLFDSNHHDETDPQLRRPGLILLLQAGIFRRAVFERIGDFDPGLRVGEDADWFLRALEQSIEMVVHPEIVIIYRRHAANLTGSLQRSQQQLMMALRRSLARRRQIPNSTECAASLHFVPATDR